MIGTTVARYKIVDRIGGGGMGVVYEAEDTELGRRVALKFLPEDTADNAEALERFKREARAASALNHPHICTVHDIGSHGDRPYLVMERMHGHTLNHLIEDNKLPADRVVEIGEQIADALDAAHRAGIVHRDLKPSNLFVTERGEVKVLDFGLAKLTVVEDDHSRAGGKTPGEHETTPGMAVGTVAYMSPEQARGQAVDARSDLFALGIVLYRMVSGRMPFPSVSTGDFYRALLSDPPVPLRAVDEEVPPPLEEIIFKCLEKDPALRYQTASGVRADLKRMMRDTQSSAILKAASHSYPAPTVKRSRRTMLLGLAGVVLAFAAGALWFANRAGSPTPAPATVAEPAQKRIAVLPFENLGAAEDGYFAEGMADEVQSKLAGLPGLAVIARGSTLEYRGTSKRPDEIARELDARYLLTATVRWQRSGTASRIRVTPALVEVDGEGAPVTRWQEAFDAELADVFEVQSRIATQVAQALDMALGSREEQLLSERPTSNLAAYDAFLRGREINDRGFDNQTQRESAAQFEQAVALDPDFALAWAHLSIARSLAYANGGVRSSQAREQATAAAATALRLAPDLADAYWATAILHRAILGDPAGAIEVLQRGLAVAPDDVNLLRNVGLAEQERGHLEAALAPMRRAEFLDPRNWLNKVALADTQLRLHRSAEGRESANRGLALNPVNFDLILLRVQSHLQEGDLAAARAFLATSPPQLEPAAIVAYFAGFGSRAWALEPSARELLLRLEPDAFGGDRGAWGRALANEYWLRGDLESARRYAREARTAYREQLANSPDEAILHAALGSTLSFFGDADAEAAVREGQRAVELAPLDKDGYIGTESLHLLTLIHIRLGHRAQAIEVLERVLQAPYWITPAWLRIDPHYDSLRGDPRFERLAAGSS